MIRPLAERTAELAEVHARWIALPAETERPDVEVTPPQPVDLTDEQLLEKARNAADGGKFRRLYDEGDTSEYARGSNDGRSEGEMALIQKLAFWTNRDPERMDRLFRGSALYREKWEREDYRERTIEKAIEHANKTGKYYTGEDKPFRGKLLAHGRVIFDGSQPTGSPPTGNKPAEAPRRRFTLIPFPEFLKRPRPRYLVDDMLQENSLAALVGPYGTYKSFIALDLALCVGTGEPWIGREVVQGPAVYVIGESEDVMNDRIRAWQVHRGLDAPAECYMITEAVQLMQAGDVAALEAEVAEACPQPPKLIVIDTLARAMVGGDENSQKDMGLLIAGADRLRAATRACVLLIHHTNKAGGIRGSTALPGGLDTIMEVSGDGDQAELTCEKQKGAARFDSLRLLMRKVQIAPMVTNIVMEPAVGEAAAARGSMLRVLALLTETFGGTGATNAQWLKVCQEAGLKDRSYYYARKELIAKGLVAEPEAARGGRFTVTPAGVAAVPNAAALAGAGRQF